MNPTVKKARARLAELLEGHDCTRGLYVRVSGRHLTLGRTEPVFETTDVTEDDDRLRLTHLGHGQFGLSVKRNTGRWEETPFAGEVDHILERILTTMQHLVADWP